MNQITLIKCDDGAIWVTSDEDQIGKESIFDKITDERKQMMIALANFLGYEPGHILDFEGILEYDLENGGIMSFEDDELEEEL